MASSSTSAPNSPPTQRPEQRIVVLDAFRAVAITMVMLQHYLVRYAPPYHVPGLYGYARAYPTWLIFGAMGVQFFFMISGFVIFMTLEHCTHLIEFWVRRIARLYPAYIAGTLITFTAVRAIGPAEFHRTAFDVLVGLTFFTRYVPGARFVDGSYWSLVAEMQFYFVVGLIYWRFRYRFALAWTAYALIGAVLWWLGGEMFHPLRTIARHIFLVESIPYFTLGILFFYIFAKRREGVGLLACAALISYAATSPGIDTPKTLLTLPMIALFALFVARKFEWIALPPLIFAGSISYSFYLLHQYIGVSLIPIFTGVFNFPDALAFGASALVCSCLAYGLYRTVEIEGKRVILQFARTRIFPVVESRLKGLRFDVPSRSFALGEAPRPAHVASEVRS